MSKKKVEDGSQEPVDSIADTPQAETPASKPGKTKNTDYTCPVCKHTTGIKIGAPYEKGNQTLQYVKCKKCEHLGVDVL